MAYLRLNDIPSWSEVEKIWRKVLRQYRKKKISLRVVCLLGVLFTTGARISEIISLRREDVNIKEEVIRIKQLKKRKEVVREVLIHPDIKPYLLKYINVLRKGERLFPFTRQNAYYLVKKHTGYRPHAFRHVVAIKILSETRDLELVRRVLGHANYSVLKEYLNYTMRDRKTELEEALRLSG